MIILKSPREIEIMREAGRRLASVHKKAREALRPGMSTYELDKLIHSFILEEGGKPSFLGYQGFPASSCISLNDTVIHGIPSKDIILEEGDVVSLDLGLIYQEYHSDAARTLFVGQVDEEKKKLVSVTKESFFKGLEFCRQGYRLSDISHAIQNHCESQGYSVVREFTGHGIGKDLHEDPAIPNYGKPGRGPRLTPGMVLAIEPMINLGKKDIFMEKDGWTVRTSDGRPSAHYEHTVLITESDPELLTWGDEEC